MAQSLIGVDLGGTRIRAARLDNNLEILERHETLTLADQGRDATIKRIIDLIKEVLPENHGEIAGIGISAPGPLDPRSGVVVAPPNLPGWHNVPLAQILTEAFDVPVYVGNDANVAALAEVSRGAARGYRHAIYITVSTGIGSGMVINGRLLLGHTGLAAEAGHAIIIVDGDKVSSLEKEAAGPALAKQARVRIEAGEKSQILHFANNDIQRIDGHAVGEAAKAGDKLALEIVQRAGHIIGLGVVTLLHLFNPEIVVIGGGVSTVGHLLFDPLWDAVRKHALDEAYWRELKIVQPDLGEDVSIIGAATLVKTRGGQESISDIMNS